MPSQKDVQYVSNTPEPGMTNSLARHKMFRLEANLVTVLFPKAKKRKELCSLHQQVVILYQWYVSKKSFVVSIAGDLAFDAG
jgi:hypothetical protein